MPDMIDSEIKWLGDIAESYQLKALKYCMTLEGKGSYPASFGETEGTYPFFTSGQKKLFCEEYEYDGEYILIGDGGTFNATYINGKFSASDHTLVYKVNKGVSTQFVHKFLNAHEESLDKITFKGMGMRNIQRPLLEKVLLPLPDLATQQRIADLLDTETGKIDNLVDELTRFKSKLQLQKRSLVSECVTKGVPEDRNREYKDSGVKWLGEIPAGWEVSRIKNIGSIIMGATPDSSNESYWDGDVSWATPVDISDSKYVAETKRTLTDEGLNNCSARLLPVGSVVLSTRAPIGSVALNAKEMATNQGCKSIVVNYKAINSFIYYYIKSISSVLNAMGTGTTFPELSTQVLKSVKLPLPPINEQQRIADYLDTETNKIDALIGEIDSQSNLLKTYRKSLINEVVTGKVEV